MTRILHVHRDFAPDQGGGGVARHIHGLAKIASKQGFEVRVVAPAARAPHDELAYDVRAAAIASLWPHVGWADVVHVHGSRNPIAAAAAAMAGSRGKRLVYTPHCYYDDGGALKRVVKRVWDETVERQLLASSDAVVLLADFWLDLLRARGLEVREPVILPNCVLETAVLSHAAAPHPLEGNPALLSVGRLDRVKRLDDAIRALNETGLASAALHIVGLGPDRARLEAVAADAGVSPRVRFHGFVPDAEVAAMAAAADCFLLPSSAEGGPTVLIEMLLLGCKVVASDIPGSRVILTAAGWQQGLHALGDISALARTVRHVTAQTMSPDVREEVRNAFTWEQKTPQIVSLYQAQYPVRPSQTPAKAGMTP